MNNPSDIEHLIRSVVNEAPPEQLEVECRGIDLNEAGPHARTPLAVAAAVGNLSAVELLVRNGASVHATGRGQMTAMHEASASGEVAVVKYLIDNGAEINAETIDGVTPLMCAAAWGNLGVVKLLLDSGADRTKTDNRGATAEDTANEKCEREVAELLRS